MDDIEKERMRSALKIIAEKSCERLTTGPGSCWSQPAWTSEAQYSDDRWCDGCIALAALMPLGPAFHAEPQRSIVDAALRKIGSYSQPALRDGDVVTVKGIEGLPDGTYRLGKPWSN